MLASKFSPSYEIPLPIDPNTTIHQDGGLPNTVWQDLARRDYSLWKAEKDESVNPTTYGYARAVLSGLIEDRHFTHRDYLNTYEWGDILRVSPLLSDVTVYVNMERERSSSIEQLLSPYRYSQIYGGLQFDSASNTWGRKEVIAYSSHQEARYGPLEGTGIYQGGDEQYEAPFLGYETVEEPVFAHVTGLSDRDKNTILAHYKLTQDDVPNLEVTTPAQFLYETLETKVRNMTVAERREFLKINDLVNLKFTLEYDYNGFRSAPEQRAASTFATYLIEAFKNHFGYQPHTYISGITKGYPQSIACTLASLPINTTGENLFHPGTFKMAAELPQVRFPSYKKEVPKSEA
jgi:hypothetical protein